MLSQKAIDRFWRKVNKTDSCWEWIGCIGTGYGHGTMNGKRYLAHRMSWQIHFGEIREGMEICHRCNNRKCVRPDHLYEGTHSMNIRDAYKDGILKQRKGWQNRKLPNKLTPAQVSEIRCRIPFKGCLTRWAKEYHVDRSLIGLIRNEKIWVGVR